MMNANSINSLSVNGIAVDDNMGYDGNLGMPRNPLNLLWEHLLGTPTPVVVVYKKPPQAVLVYDARQLQEDDDELAINTKQIGVSVLYENKIYTQAIDRSEHGFVISIPHFKMHVDHLMSDMKTVMEYEVKDFKIEQLKEDDNETVQN